MLDAVAHAFNTLRSVAGRGVRYQRGETAIDLVSVPAETAAELQEHGGLVAEVEIRDELIAVQDLAELDPKRPESGDRIELEHDDGTVEILEVMAPSGNVPVWRYHGPGRVAYRIHTKLVETRDVQ